MPTSQQLQNIDAQKLGLRVGTVANGGAAYGMSDFGDGPLLPIMQWIMNPNGNPALTQDWDEHLHNSVWKIDDLFPNGTAYNLMIVSGAPVGGGERYAAPGGIGNLETFRKCNKTQPNAQIIAQQGFQGGQVNQALQWVLNNLP